MRLVMTKRSRAVLAALILAALWLAPMAGHEAAAAATAANYTLGAGDKLKITVFGEDDLSGDFVIAGDGTMALPLIGDVPAGGKSLRGLEQLITTRLKDGYLKAPQVSVEVINYRPFYILGEVQRPGSYPYVNGMTVLTAVALGGGFTYRARKEPIYVSRAGDEERKEMPVNPDDPILPGDVIRVRERFF